MNGAILLCFLFATLGDARSEESCLTGNCTGNEAQVVKAIDSFHNSWHALNEREMFGTICNTTIKGDFYESKWLWQGRFWCPSLSTIEGFSKNQKSRDNAIKHATDDYIRKGKQLGFLTENRVRDSFDIKLNSIFPSINLESRYTKVLIDEVEESSTDEKPTKVYNNGIYTGDMVNGKEHGAGIFLWKSGATYIGMWRNGDMHGIGTYYYADGLRYVGQFKNNEQTGYGIMKYPSGYVYQGDYVDSMRSGYGKESLTDGDKYIGQFKNDDRHGFGYWILADGTKRAAFYFHGEEF